MKEGILNKNVESVVERIKKILDDSLKPYIGCLNTEQMIANIESSLKGQVSALIGEGCEDMEFFNIKLSSVGNKVQIWPQNFFSALLLQGVPVKYSEVRDGTTPYLHNGVEYWWDMENQSMLMYVIL